MKKFLLSAVLSSLFITTFAQFPLSDNRDSVSYAMGIDIAKNLQRMGVNASDINIDAITAGMSAAVDPEAKPLLDDSQKNQLTSSFFQSITARKTAQATAKARAWLAENGAKEGVITLPSGLQYKVITSGPTEGTKPLASSKVTVHYEGRLTNGEVFDSSYKRGEPMTFGVGQVIKGWTQGLQLMRPGDKYQLYIPPELAYGQRGAPPKIGPWEALVFDVELISIQ